MGNWPRGQMRALIAIFALLILGIGVMFWQRGRAAEEAFVITGRPLSTFSVVQNSANATHSLPSFAPEAQQVPSPTLDMNERAGVKQLTTTPSVVHVAGAVRKPGVYRLAADARVEEAVKAAGGAREDANLDAINLAARLEDGSQIYVPNRKEQPTGGAPEAATYFRISGHSQTTSVQKTFGPYSSSRPAKLTVPGQGTVNINTANAEELQRLPGVGPATAARILEYRKEIGSFSSPEQLMDVSGIGEKKFEKMQPFVRTK